MDIAAPDTCRASGTIDMGSENQDAQYWMVNASRFTFVIKDKVGMTPVPDAEVRIDSALAGKTDSKGILYHSRQTGKNVHHQY